MLFDRSKLRGRIIEKFGSCKNCATALGITPATLTGRLNCAPDFKLYEVYRLCNPDMLDIHPDEIYAYFFTPKVR